LGLTATGVSALPAAAAGHQARIAATAGPVPNPTVEGPVTGGVRGYPWNHTIFPLTTTTHDYSENEFFFSGTATDLSTGNTSAYKSRMLVRFPKDPANFNGTVLFDWMNVTDQQDYEFNWWPTAYEALMNAGYGYVAVSAQQVGVNHLHTWDPTRYASLSHPGDAYSYDIYAQAIEALRNPANSVTSKIYAVGVTPQYAVAGGVSQSAGKLASFINGGYNRGGLIDAYNIERALGSTINDYSTFIFELNEETSFTGAPAAPRPPDTNHYVVWEEAGTAHEAIAWWSYRFATDERDLVVPAPDPVNMGCSVNRGQVEYSVRAMLYWTQQYLHNGTIPPSAPRIPRNSDNTPVRDADGLATGGLRQPFIQVPIALNRSTQQDCPFWGTYQPWTTDAIRARYPTKADYVNKVRDWADYEVSQGWLLPADRDDAVANAQATMYWVDNTPVVAEGPYAGVLPLAGLMVVGGLVLRRRRRRAV
jgi:MYXO-CTERM domain-containing protein